MSSDAIIEVRGLGKDYRIFDRPQDRFKQILMRGRRQYYTEFPAIKNVDFEIARGETMGIIGRNGSGKSTLLQIICGTLQQSTGELNVRGRIAALLELGSGFNPEFTGRENVSLYASVLGLDDTQLNARFDSIVAFADIGDFLDQPIKTYSSGMVVRLAFAVIAHVDADILIIDEALSVGDAYFVQKCLRFLREFSQRGTLLFVSHDTSAVLNLCDRAVWLDKGEVRQIGDAKSVVGRYLEGLYGEQDAEYSTPAKAVTEPPADAEEYLDQRDEVINRSNLRTDIRLVEFDAGAAEFSVGLAEILDVAFFENGKRLGWMVGGEKVRLDVRCSCAVDLDRPVIGFNIKNRLGQSIFGDNTELAYLDDPITLPAGAVCCASFEFTMPRLPSGSYTLDAAISNGDRTNHQILNWKYDVLAFTVEAGSMVHGLVGVPMRSIRLAVERDS
jgi:lipopolysaccharide transport system ATP-binding protein